MVKGSLTNKLAAMTKLQLLSKDRLKFMPEIARFYGIIIRIFYEFGRHQLPHIHAAYGEYVASFSIDPPALLAGVCLEENKT